MKIKFDKILKNHYDFNLKNKNIHFEGYLKKIENDLVLCKAHLFGQLPHNCDSCGQDLVLDADEELELFLSNGIYKSKDDNFIDVIEFFDGEINLEELLDSELELFKSDHFYCDNCQKKE